MCWTVGALAAEHLSYWRGGSMQEISRDRRSLESGDSLTLAHGVFTVYMRRSNSLRCDLDRKWLSIAPDVAG